MKVTDFDLQPTLTGGLIRLRPLRLEDFEELYGCASDPLIWELHPKKTRYQREVFQRFFNGAMASGGAFAVIDQSTGSMIGSSRFYDYQPEKSQVNVGYTFLAKKYWGGHFNREMKSLMLSHAFQFCENVVFQIGEGNLRSRRAIEKIGAKILEKKELDGDVHLIYRIERS